MKESELKIEIKPEESEINKDFDRKRQILMKRHLDLMQEQLDLPGRISEVLLKIKDRPMGTEEGDRLRKELDILEERNRTIHLSIQDNFKELKECERSSEKIRAFRKTA